MGESQTKTILQSEALKQYILETSAFPREHEQLKELKKATVEKYKFWSLMNLPADEAQFLSMLLKIMNAKKTLEIGVFTGYSLLSTALSLPHDGKIIAIDPDKDAYETGLPFIRKAGVDHKVQFIQSDAVTIIKELINSGVEEGTFDFIFMDGDKENYQNYHELLLKLVKVGGVIAYDDTLWFGTVAQPNDDDLAGHFRTLKRCFVKLNSVLATDPRIEISLLSIGGGLTLCRRLY